MKKLIVISLLMVVLCGCGTKQTDNYFVEAYESESSYTYVYLVKQERSCGYDRTIATFKTLDEAVIYKTRLDSLVAVHALRRGS